jgi:hypothetical protein
MPNRVFYASHAVSVSGTTVCGAQSVGITTNFNLAQVFELGQVALYDNLVQNAEVQVTVSKVLDGESSIWALTGGDGLSLVQASALQSDIVIGVGSDTAETITSTSAITCTGMYVSAVSYTFPVDGNFTEEVTFVGNSKALSGSVSAPAVSGALVNRRQNFNLTSSNLPAQVDGKNISSVRVSAQLGRESLYKLGQFAPYYRFVSFPLEVTCDFDTIADDTDGVELDLTADNCDPVTLPAEEQITIVVCDANENRNYTLDLGSKCRLTSVNYTGGDTGGGNVTVTYSYRTYNDLTISDS